MTFKIEDFWFRQFSGLIKQNHVTALPGWSFNSTPEKSYIQADLKLRNGFDDLNQKVWLIGAPGAVGKSTLAQEICAATGAVYLDLASASTVAGNYIIGGLAHTNLLSSWIGGQVAVVIDALDEARLRVTQSGFEAFLTDVANTAKLGHFPIILLGRVGIIEEAWTILNELTGLNPPIFDIELFNQSQANNFVLARLKKYSEELYSQEKYTYPDLRGALDTHAPVYKNVIRQIIQRIQELSTQDGNHFVGYAPVLDAVSKVIASKNNPAKIGDEMLKALEGEILTNLATTILYREQDKLINQLENTIPNIPDHLYEPKEQLERLGAKLFGIKQPPLPSQLTQQQVASYEEAVNNLLPQHPFLDGSGSAPSSAVFAACIVAAALKGDVKDLVAGAEKYTNSPKHTPNPFLCEFYAGKEHSDQLIPTEHIGLIFESLLARSKPGEAVRMSVEDEEDSKTLAVEILINQANQSPYRKEFIAPSTGTLRLGRRVSGVSIDAENTSIEVGAAGQLELIAPVFISAKSLKLCCTQILIKAETDSIESTVILEGEVLNIDPGLSAPIVRTGAEFQVSWPEANSYPWTQFRAPNRVDENPKTAEALRALRRFVMAFRSHSKGELARFKDKIEHQRMLKGHIGEVLLKKLVSDQVIILRSPMYILDANALGSKTGASYGNVKLKRYSAQTIEYLQKII